MGRDSCATGWGIMGDALSRLGTMGGVSRGKDVPEMAATCSGDKIGVCLRGIIIETGREAGDPCGLAPASRHMPWGSARGDAFAPTTGVLCREDAPPVSGENLSQSTMDDGDCVGGDAPVSGDK